MLINATACNIDPKQWKQLLKAARKKGIRSGAGALRWAIACAITLDRHSECSTKCEGGRLESR
jgi:hypothetical protein